MRDGLAACGLYARAPRRRANDLLIAYRDAGTSSVNAAVKIAAITADHQELEPRPARRSRNRLSVAGRMAPGATIALTEPDLPPGPVERILVDLGITDPELLNRGNLAGQSSQPAHR